MTTIHPGELVREVEFILRTDPICQGRASAAAVDLIVETLMRKLGAGSPVMIRSQNYSLNAAREQGLVDPVVPATTADVSDDNGQPVRSIETSRKADPTAPGGYVTMPLPAAETPHEQPRPYDVELAAYAWIDGEFGVPEDRDYSSDQMIDAYMAGHAAAITASSNDAQGREDEPVWLIERRVDPPQWSVDHAPTGVGAFYQDVQRAHRFPSKAAAETALRRMSITPEERSQFFVSEHIWMSDRVTAQSRDAIVDEVERFAQWLHDEGGFGDAWPDHTWPEHPDDTGQRDGGWVKIVPSDVQAKFREVARRWLIGRNPSATSSREAGLREALKGMLELVDAIQHNNPSIFIPSLNFNGKVVAARAALSKGGDHA